MEFSVVGFQFRKRESQEGR